MHAPQGGELKLSVVIPVFNEAATIREVVQSVRAVKIPKDQNMPTDQVRIDRPVASSSSAHRVAQ
jgi:hypothetical protein